MRIGFDEQHRYALIHNGNAAAVEAAVAAVVYAIAAATRTAAVVARLRGEAVPAVAGCASAVAALPGAAVAEEGRAGSIAVAAARDDVVAGGVTVRTVGSAVFTADTSPAAGHAVQRKAATEHHRTS